MNKNIKIAVLGASGYTGGDLIRILLNHNNADIVALSANSKLGKNPSDVHAALYHADLPDFISVKEINFDEVDLVISGLPHNNLHKLINDIPAKCKVIDMSADFRFSDSDIFNQYYQTTHESPEVLKSSVYGLSEIYRNDIKDARIVACPGCYPTAILLSIIPLIKDGIISIEDIIIDAKSGVSGAGRSNKEDLMFSELSESMKPYNIASHRHTPEIEKIIENICGKELKINFTPHLIPINRGELITLYLKTLNGFSAMEAQSCLNTFYKNDRYVHISNKGLPAETSNVRGSNNCLISVFDDRIKGRIIISASIDNLIKGSAGQAIQNMNIMFGFDEGEGLTSFGLYP